MDIARTVRICAGDDPQPLLAVTDIAPPEVEGVTVIDEVMEVPAQPEGNVQV